jgi:hypothetical protein
MSPELMGASDRLAHETITDDQRAWLASLPLTRQVADRVLAFHGSPIDDLTYLLETVEPTGARPASEAEVLDRLGEAASGAWSLLLCRHTHLQRQMHLPSGTLVVNPAASATPPTPTTGRIRTSSRPVVRTRATPSSMT